MSSLVTMYTSLLEDKIASHGFGRMIYADDTQVYVIKKKKKKKKKKTTHEREILIPKPEQCLLDIKAWATANYFKLNEDKTEVLHIISKLEIPLLYYLMILPMFLFSLLHLLATYVGVIVANDDLNMDVYISNVCCSASHALYKIGRIRNRFDEKLTETLVIAFIICHLDGYDSLSDTLIAKLQRIQNSTARLVTRTRAHDHITPVLGNLHWLSVKYLIIRRIQKILLLTYKCLYGLVPDYLADFIQELTNHLATYNHLSSSNLLYSLFLPIHTDNGLILYIMLFGMGPRCKALYKHCIIIVILLLLS